MMRATNRTRDRTGCALAAVKVEALGRRVATVRIFMCILRMYVYVYMGMPHQRPRPCPPSTSLLFSQEPQEQGTVRRDGRAGPTSFQARSLSSPLICPLSC